MLSYIWADVTVKYPIDKSMKTRQIYYRGWVGICYLPTHISEAYNYLHLSITKACN